MNACQLTLLSLIFAGTAFAADPPVSAPAPATSVDLTAEALPVLQAKYPDFKDLQAKAGDHLSDLIARSNGKISLTTPESGAVVASPSIMTVSLPDNILYWRVVSFQPKTSWSEMGSQLKQTGNLGLVLDLRSNSVPDDYQGAAQLLGLLAPSDSTLSHFQSDASGSPETHPSVEPAHLPIVVLTDNRTTGAAEAVAARLKADGALVVGEATAGKIGIFAEQKLSSGQVLRFLVTPLESDAHSLTWDQPVTPDIGVTVSDWAEKGVLTLIKTNHILDVIKESDPRHRLSEATLVKGEDPEWDAYLVTLEKKNDDNLIMLPPVHDAALIAALDNLKAIRLSQRPPITPVPLETQPAAASLP